MRTWLFTSAVVLVVLWAQRARAEVEGRYQTEGQSINVKIESWGDDCGPRPRSASSGGGKVVSVRRVGTHLAVGGQRTDQCWSRNPRVKRVRAVAGTNRWTSVCETPANDPRFEHGEYTLEVTGEGAMRFREVSRYDWRLEGDHCKATVTLTRSYSRLPDAPSAPPESPEEADVPQPSVCSGDRGAPVKLELRPPGARIDPGGRICFRASSQDRDGCPVPIDVTWSLGPGGDAIGRLGPDGCFVASATTGVVNGRALIVASAGDLSARARVTISLSGIGDLVASRLAEGIEQPGDVVTPALEARGGAGQGVGQTSVGPLQGERLTLWIGLGLGLVVLAILVGVVARVVRRRRSDEDWDDDVRPLTASMPVASGKPPSSSEEKKTCTKCKQEFDGGVSFCPKDGTRLVSLEKAAGQQQRSQSLICPKCRRGFMGGETHCPQDRVELVPYSQWRATQLEARKTASGMICPKCSTRYEQGVVFCQNDGTKLEPIN